MWYTSQKNWRIMRVGSVSAVGLKWLSESIAGRLTGAWILRHWKLVSKPTFAESTQKQRLCSVQDVLGSSRPNMFMRTIHPYVSAPRNDDLSASIFMHALSRRSSILEELSTMLAMRLQGPLGGTGRRDPDQTVQAQKKGERDQHLCFF